MAPSISILNSAALLERAQRETGLSDYGDQTLSARLSLAVEEIRKRSLGEKGEHAAADVIHWLLTTRLQFFEDRKRYPIASEKITRPIFATGEPRSGTTLLHALLAVDPNGRALRFWEIMYPSSPPPGLAAPDDPRRAKAHTDWQDIEKKIPRWLTSHPYNDMMGDGLPECERTWAFDFRAMTPTAWWRVPMNTINLPNDPHTQYGLHKMMLQHCQYGRPPKYWVLKGFHGRRLAALFDTYPDAAIIWVHRDPVQTIASRIVLVGQIYESIVGHLDWKTFAAETLALSRESFRANLSEPMIDDPRIHHVRYPDFVHNPVGTIRTFYEKYGVPFTAETEEAMKAYLTNNRGDRYGKFVYSVDVIGADVNDLHREFAPYRERFGLDIETRK
ncbi:MAG: sulfotransferase [Rhodospirillaceae bacterium]|nr:MAG: sulfotransferase [Rhodospirillaceae bacterium]